MLKKLEINKIFIESVLLYCKNKKINFLCTPFDIESFKETLLSENDLNNALWVIASDLREMKKQGLFKSYRAAYRHGAKRLTTLGRKVTWKKQITAK